MDKVELAKQLGQNIRFIRKSKGMTQSDLGIDCGRNKQGIAKIENGKVNITTYTLYQIAQALEVDPRDLWTSIE